jgi:hypothetical protein
MEPVPSTVYSNIVPDLSPVDHLGPSQQSGTKPLVKLPKLATPNRVSDETFHHRIVADISLLALIVTTAIFVASLIAIFVTSIIVNWSH